MKIRFLSTIILAGVLTIPADARVFNVKPGDKSFTRAAKKWKSGDTIILAPGEYHERFEARPNKRTKLNGLTIRAAIPGSVVFRGDRPTPEFTSCGSGIWKAQYPVIPEVVFERDTLTRYIYAGTVAELERQTGRWTYDSKTKTLYIRTSDSGEPSKHCLTVGVTPKHGFNIYSTTTGDAPENILFEGFAVTGFYSRIKAPDQRIPSSQRKVPWGVIVNHPRKNVVIRNVTAMLNGHGIGFCLQPVNGIIDNCRAWGNGNPFATSGTGIGIYTKNQSCAVTNNIGADNTGNDVFLYGGPFAADTKFDSNRAWGQIRVKGGKEKEFKVTNCIAYHFSHLDHPRHLQNCVSFRGVASGEQMTKNNLLCAHERSLKPDQIFADWENFDCRPMAGVPESIVRRSAQKPCSTLFFVSAKGNDSANGRSVKTAFATLARAQKELAKSGAEVYIVDAVKGNITLKGAKNVSIRGRGKYAAKINGSITLENCSNVKLERLMPNSITIKNGKDITVSQSYGKLDVSGTENLRLTHNYFSTAGVSKAKNAFITANVFDAFSKQDTTGWSDYNAFAGNVPADEKHSFKAKAVSGSRGTFKNAWLFNGRAIDAMPVGPFRRQMRNVKLEVKKLNIKSVTPNTAVVEIEANIPFSCSISYSDGSKSGSIELNNGLCRQNASLTGLEPGKKYTVTFRAKANKKSCFSNADLTGIKSTDVVRGKKTVFTTPAEFARAKEYFVSPSGSDSADGSADAPFATVSSAVNKLLPGDTLTIRGGNYIETVDVNVSGTPERPITIRGAKGENVIFNGGFGCALEDGFRIFNQQNLIFENFKAIGKGMSDSIGYSSSPVIVSNSSNITFRRLLIGGGKYRIKADNSKAVLIENCVFAFGHEGLSLGNTEAVVRNCTFAFGGVNQITVRNYNNAKFVLENNIILDMLLMKGSNAIVHMHNPDVFTGKNNCYYTRLPEKERRIYGWNYNNGKLVEKNVVEQIAKFPYLGRRQMPYATFLKEFNRPYSAVFANPGLKIMKEFLVTYPTLKEWKKKWRKDQKESWKEYQFLNDEARMTFENYLPTDPEIIKRGIGPVIK